MKTITRFTYFGFASLALACFTLSHTARAVVPAPDGGYPNGNTAEGQNALLSLSTGGFNTAVGFFSLRSDTTGQLNTGVGAGTLLANTGDQNTASGAGALLNNTTGLQNTANGALALLGNTTGGNNTAVGSNALSSNTTGSGNVAVGDGALASNTAPGINTDDGANVAVGFGALKNTDGTGSNSGGGNTAVGQEALEENSTGFFNNAFGNLALSSNTTGFSNTAMGFNALFSSTTGFANTGVGVSALFHTTTGTGNTAFGATALFFNITGGNNIGIGNNAGSLVTTANNAICIGAAGANVSNSCFIGNIFGQTSTGGAPVLVNSNGQLGTMTSSQRFKEAIEPMQQASEALFVLEPVTFRYKKEIDPANKRQFGLVAEQVEKVNPDLVVRDQEGKPYSVRYDQVNAMLLNEFLKEHRKVQDLEANAAKQQKQIEALTEGLRKVSAQLGTANGADGISDIEGKAVMGSGEQAGTQASFNGAAGMRSDIDESSRKPDTSRSW